MFYCVFRNNFPLTHHTQPAVIFLVYFESTTSFFYAGGRKKTETRVRLTYTFNMFLYVVLVLELTTCNLTLPWEANKQTCFPCLIILHPTAKITESLNVWNWKAPLEIILSNIPAQEGSPRKDSPGPCPDQGVLKTRFFLCRSWLLDDRMSEWTSHKPPKMYVNWQNLE